MDKLGPYELNQIVTGDARELAKAIPDESVSLVMIDPPFGVRDEDWDQMDEFELASFTMQWLIEARRISPRLITFFSAKYRRMIETLTALIYPSVRLMIWNKPIGSQYAGSSEDGLWYSYEIILYCHQGYDKPKALTVAEMIKNAREGKGLSRGGIDMVIRGKKTGLCFRWEEAACLPTKEQASKLQEILGLDGKFIDALELSYTTAQKAIGKDVFDYRTVTNGNHPCAKPEGLICELLEALTQSDDIVADFFTGGGTVPAVCKMLGRNYLAFEIDPDTAERARDRVRLTQPPLFVLQPEQLNLALEEATHD